VESAGPPGAAVHPDPLAGAAARGAHEGDLDGVALLGGRPGAADACLDPRKLLAPAHDLALGAGAMAPAPGQQDDRLEQACLACGVRAPDQLWARLEDGVERRVAPEVADGDAPQDRGVGRRRGGAFRGRRVRQDVVRTGITTWM
jgi:hypothetical protein